MRLFVRYDVLGALLANTERQIYARLDDTENEGRSNVLALINVLLVKHRRAYALFELQVADERVYDHRKYADEPKYREDRYQKLEKIYFLLGRNRHRRTADYRRDSVVDAAKAGVYIAVNVKRLAEISRHYVGADRLGARDQAENALDRERADKSESDHAPKSHADPFGRLFHKQAQKQYRKNDVARRDAHVEYVQKYLAHLFSPLL